MSHRVLTAAGQEDFAPQPILVVFVLALSALQNIVGVRGRYPRFRANRDVLGTSSTENVDQIAHPFELTKRAHVKRDGENVALKVLKRRLVW